VQTPDDNHGAATAPVESFPTDPTGLPEGGRPEVLELAPRGHPGPTGRPGGQAPRRHETQAPIPVGGRFTYRIQFPDAGLYWYHPHIREDYTQELGLYGNILVTPSDPGYWPPADRDLVLTLDDLLVTDGQIAPFSPTETRYGPRRDGPRRHGPRRRRRHRVERRHGRGQPGDHRRHHALAVRGPDQRHRQPGDRLALHRRRAGQAPAGE